MTDRETFGEAEFRVWCEANGAGWIVQSYGLSAPVLMFDDEFRFPVCEGGADGGPVTAEAFQDAVMQFCAHAGLPLPWEQPAVERGGDLRGRHGEFVRLLRAAGCATMPFHFAGAADLLDLLAADVAAAEARAEQEDRQVAALNARLLVARGYGEHIKVLSQELEEERRLHGGTRARAEKAEAQVAELSARALPEGVTCQDCIKHITSGKRCTCSRHFDAHNLHCPRLTDACTDAPDPASEV